jgi:hypothetical protein
MRNIQLDVFGQAGFETIKGMLELQRIADKAMSGWGWNFGSGEIRMLFDAELYAWW